MTVSAYVVWVFLGSVGLMAVVGSAARARLTILIRDRHPELYRALGCPSPWVGTSLFKGIKWQRMVFARKVPLCEDAEAARTYLRRVTVVVLVVLLAQTVLVAWVLGHAV